MPTIICWNNKHAFTDYIDNQSIYIKAASAFHKLGHGSFTVSVIQAYD